MSDDLLYYKPSALVKAASAEFPGTRAFARYTELYKAGAVPYDRTGTIRTPVKSHPLFPIPTMQRFTKSLEEVCNDRAAELIARADAHDCDIYVLWSGGIDSTLALVSLLKNATPEQRKRIVVLLSERSIRENQRFYEEHIRGNLRRDTSAMLSVVLGTRNILVSGEHNDQLFGSDIIAPMSLKHGTGIIHAPYDRDLLKEQYESVLKDPILAEFYVSLFERLPASSPVPIVSMFDFVWWINFSLKWQTVYARTLTYTAPHNVSLITEDYLRDFYAPFYNTDSFQLWSLNNQDKRIRDTWASYKWPCKDIIFEFTGDAQYRDTKLKVGSLAAFVISKRSYKALRDDLTLDEEFDLSRFYEPNNDFIEIERSMNLRHIEN